MSCKTGTKRGTHVSTTCAIGKGRKMIPPLKKDELGQFGYEGVKHKKSAERHAALRHAVREFGAPSVFRRLGAISTLNKRTSPGASEIFKRDQRWVKKEFSNQFKG